MTDCEKIFIFPILISFLLKMYWQSLLEAEKIQSLWNTFLKNIFKSILKIVTVNRWKTRIENRKENKSMERATSQYKSTNRNRNENSYIYIRILVSISICWFILWRCSFHWFILLSIFYSSFSSIYCHDF